MVEEEAGGAFERGQIGPPAVVGELVLEVAPDARDEVELGGRGGQPQGPDAVAMGDPSAADLVTVVVAAVVEDHDDLGLGERHCQLVPEAHERGAVLRGAGAPHHPPGGVVQRAEDRELLVLARCRDPQGAATPPPDLRQLGVAMDLAFVQVDEMELPGGGAFPSQANTSFADATAAWSCRWRRSCRGRR